MDVIVASTVVAQAANILIEKYQERQARAEEAAATRAPSRPEPANVAAPPPPPPRAESDGDGDGGKGPGEKDRDARSEGDDDKPADSDSTATDGKDGAPQDDIARLEAKLAELHDRAKKLTSPDAFVQYAQVTREANRVEKELGDLKAARRAANPAGAEGDAVDALAEWLSSAASGLGGQAARGAGRSAAATGVVSVAHTAFLWAFFRWGPWGRTLFDGTRTATSFATRLPCDVLRPITRLVASRAGFDQCRVDDWVCAADAARSCTVGVAGAAVMANVAVRALRRAFLRRRDDDGSRGW